MKLLQAVDKPQSEDERLIFGKVSLMPRIINNYLFYNSWLKLGLWIARKINI